MPAPRPVTVLLFDSFGPYHRARLRAARASMDVVGIEVGGRSDDYPWFDADRGEQTAVRRLFADRASGAIPTGALRKAMAALLDEIDPAVVAVPGWGTRAALVALAWCARRRRPAIMMCDSTASDVARLAPLERLKRGIVTGCAAGLASGQRSVAYLDALGLPRDRVWTGYDVVDNAHFATGAARARADADRTRAVLGLPQRYLLSIGRLIPKKNLANLLEGYARYVADVGADAMHLVIGGDGPLAADLRAHCAHLAVADRVVFSGHIAYDDLPAYYGLACGFALVSRGEQWGLVVNEAIACGLPVLVSAQCGAAADLVRPGCNGFICAPDADGIAGGLSRLASIAAVESFARCSSDLAAQWGLDAFVAGLTDAARQARAVPRVPARLPVAAGLLLAHVAAMRQQR